MTELIQCRTRPKNWERAVSVRLPLVLFLIGLAVRALARGKMDVYL